LLMRSHADDAVLTDIRTLRCHRSHSARHSRS
jgi:hypothetical protein